MNDTLIGLDKAVNNIKTPENKINITIKQVTNGYTIHFDRNGYAWGEKTYIAKDHQSVMDTINTIFLEL